MKNKVLRVVLISALIITLTIADFILLGTKLVTYALEDSESVKFEVYFKTGEEKVSNAQYQMNNLDMKLYMKVSVEDGTRFDGIVTLGDSNFKLKNELSDGISKIEGNVITLDSLIAGNSIEIEVGIEPIILENYEKVMLKKQSTLTLSGSHTNNIGENVNVEINKSVTLTLAVPQNIEELTKLEAKTITNSVYKVNEVDKRIAQIELNSEIASNVYPIKTTIFEVTLPEGAEVEEVISKETNATNGQADRKIEGYSIENNILKITIQNIDIDGKISWNRKGKDNIIVTLKLSEGQELSEENYSIKSKIEFYGEEQKVVEKQSTYNLAETTDGMITATVENEEEIYKGKIYSKEEREFNSTTNIEINYANLINASTLNEKIIYRTDTEDKIANVHYKTTIISKAEFDKVLGEEGTLVIKNQNGNLIKEIKSTDFVAGESITIDYSEYVKELIIEISKPIDTGVIRLKHTKVIKTEEYEIEEIRKFKYLVEQTTIKYNSESNRSEKINVLGETTANVGLTLSNTTLSEESKDITITMTLKNDNEKYELFANPEFKFTFPEGITINSVGDAIISATADNLAISTVATNKNQIILRIDGQQRQYITSDINPQITFTANVSIEKLMANKIETIKLTYLNKYVNQDNIYQIESEPINIIASNSKLVTNLKIENYDGAGNIIQKYSDSQTEVSGNLVIDSGASNATLKYTAINNYNSTISITPIIIVNDIDSEENKTRLVNYAEQDITLEAGQMQVVEIPLTIPEELYFNEKIQAQTLTEYVYSGTKYEVRNNIELKTEDKEGFRESGILDNKIQVETFVQLGDGTGIKEVDEIYNEQIIKYIIEVTNISNEPISNLKVTNAQQAGNIFDLEEVEVVNWVESPEVYIEHRYAELDTNIKTFEIDKLEAGETKELVCRVVAKKVESANNITSANISISADKIEEQKVLTLNNKVKDAEFKVNTRIGTNQEVDIYGNSTLLTLSRIKNLTNESITNTKATIYLSDGMYWQEGSTLDANDENENELDIISNIEYNAEEKYIEFNITNLEANQEIILTAILFTDKIPVTESYSEEKVYLKVDDVISNNIDIKALQIETKLNVEQRVNVTEGQKLRNGQSVILTGEIVNIGSVETIITIMDSLPEGLEPTKVTLLKNGEEIDYTEDNQSNLILIDCELSKNEKITIQIEAIINTSRITTESIQNVINVSSVKGDTIKSNYITIDIESEIDNGTESGEPEEEPKEEEPNYEKPEDEELEKNPDEEKPDDEKPEEEKPDDSNPDDKKVYYTIEGIAWVDKNENGTRDEDESIENIIVKIIDLNNKNTFLKDENGKEIEVKTGKDGQYKIENVPKGNYNIIFKYDTSIYEIEETTKIKNYIIETTKEKVAITNNIELDSNRTVDFKLIEIKEFDLKIDKYISKVVVQTANGTKTTVYADKQLVREEIQNKYLDGATVLVEYTIKITNNGELAGYATKIIDYLPKDMKFYSELNKQWYVGEDENLYNTSIASEKINIGETKTINLVLSKTMTKEDAGTTLNIAEIKETMNAKQYLDTNLSNNQSKAEMIVNPATGAIITYLVAVSNAIAIIAIGMYIIKQKIVGKELK